MRDRKPRISRRTFPILLKVCDADSGNWTIRDWGYQGALPLLVFGSLPFVLFAVVHIAGATSNAPNQVNAMLAVAVLAGAVSIGGGVASLRQVRVLSYDHAASRIRLMSRGSWRQPTHEECGVGECRVRIVPLKLALSDGAWSPRWSGFAAELVTPAGSFVLACVSTLDELLAQLNKAPTPLNSLEREVAQMSAALAYR